ncbi:hypothetical protein C0Q70_17353, partial [Pomacea canaliculata]
VRNWTRVCSRHFVPEDFRPLTLKGKQRRLKSDAVPSLFTWNNFQRGKERKQPAVRHPISQANTNTNQSENVDAEPATADAEPSVLHDRHWLVVSPSEDVCSPDPESFPTEVIPNKIKKLKPQSKKAAAPPVGRPCTICEKHEKNPAKDPRTVTLSIPPNIEALFRYAATDMRLSGAGKKKQASGSCAHRKRRSKSTVTRKNKSKRKQLSSASQNQKNKILVPTLQLPFSPGHTPSMSSNMWQNKERTERTTNKTSYVIRRKSPDFILEADGDASLLRTICQDGAVEDVISTARKSEPLLTMTEDQGVVVVKIKRKSYAESDADPLASNFSQGWQPDGMEFMSADTNITNRITPEGRNMEQIFVSKSCLKAVEGVEYTFGVASHKAELAQSKMPQDVAKLEVDSSQEVKPLIKREETVHLKKEREVKSEPIHSVDYKDCLQRDVSSCKSDMISQIVNETEKTFAVKTETRAPVEKSASYTHSLSEPDWSSVSDVEDQEDIIAVKEEPEDWSAHWFGQDSTLMDGELMKRAPGKDVYPTGLFKNIHEVHQLKGDALKTQVLEVGPCGEMFSDGPFELSSNKSIEPVPLWRWSPSEEFADDHSNLLITAVECNDYSKTYNATGEQSS